MKSNGVQWIIRLDNGALKGPLETDAVLRMIREGVFNGHESIARYPEGKWTLISREPEFYDSLMEALEGAVRSENRKTQKVMTEETIFMPPPPSSEPEKKAPLQPLSANVVPPLPAPAAAPVPKPSILAPIKDLQHLERDELVKILRMPTMVVVAALVAACAFFLLPGGDVTEDKITLLAPGKPGAPLADAEVKKRYMAIIAHVEKDTFEDYLQAQNKLVTLIEGAPSNLEIRSVLCFVYKELWIYSKQDANDQKTVSNFAQSTRILDVTSPYGGLCEAVKLITSGRYREARGSVENILEVSDSFSMRPVVYAMKAELLENEKDFQIAAPYYEKASQDWERWVKPRVRLGYVALSLRDYPRAYEWFRSVLKAYPNHKAAKIGSAFTENSGFRRYDNAIKELSEALNSKGRVPRPLESEGWQVYADLLLDRGEKREALWAAQKAYQLNPNNDLARQTVLRLGGSDKIAKDKSQNNELIFLGDQYVRQGDCLSAQAEFKAAFELDPKNGTAAMKAAKCLWQLNQSYEAIEWLNKSVRADSKLISAYVLQADYLSQRYDFSGAMQALTNASRIASNNYEVLRGMALLELRKNNMTGAINYAQRAMKAYDADIDTYVLLSKANLSLAQGIQSTMKRELERRDNAYRDAIRYATKAVEYDATSSDAQIVYAKMLAATNGTDNAADYLQGLIKKYAYSFEYRLALAEVYKEAERWNDARVIYEMVVESDPRNKKAWIGLGEALRATGFNEKALKAFLNAAVIDPTDGEALYQAGRLYYEANRFEDSLQQFKRVKGMNANFPKASFYAGKAAFALGRFEEALSFAKDEKRNNPNLADSYILTAQIYSELRAFDQCAAEYAQAIKLRPGSAEIYVKAARCYRQAGSLDIARTMLDLATERESGYAEIYLETGAIFDSQNSAEEAIAAYSKYLNLAPNAPDYKDIENRIRRLGGR